MNSKKFKESINGEEVYVELIDDREFEIVDPKYYDLLEGVGETYKISDLLLILLGINYKNPLEEIVLMKEAFLFEKELSYDLNLKFEPLQYVPYKYGPYSKILDKTLKEMDSLIEKIEGLIQLTSEGVLNTEKVLNNLPAWKVKKIKDARNLWDSYGVKGLLKRVYENYPLYTVNSEIKELILGN